MEKLHSDLQRFLVCAESYGAQRHRWPVRDQALFDTLANTREGINLLAQAEQVDFFLNKLNEVDAEPSPHLQQKICSQIRPSSSIRPAQSRWMWMPVMSVILGVGLGFASGFYRAMNDEPSLALLSQVMLGGEGFQGDML